MSEIDNRIAFILIIFAFMAGYWIISQLFKKFNLTKNGDKNRVGNIDNNYDEKIHTSEEVPLSPLNENRYERNDARVRSDTYNDIHNPHC